MWTNTIIVVVLVLALLPAALYWMNVLLYRRAPSARAELPPVSILIPARNEERTIGAAIEAALTTQSIEFEIVVLDDQSEDRTAQIVREFAAKDDRITLIESAPLPEGWCGKQHACHQLAQNARYEFLLFMDADVRLARDGIGRLATLLISSNADLVSGVPRQETGTLLERLVIPLIHFVLLGYLPFVAMRRFRLPAFGAGCGQLFLARRTAYDTAGGHTAIRTSLHDGVTLPRAFRRAGFRTDLCDATNLATCRMYRSAAELWRGLSKNAGEGMGSLRGIVPWTVLLVGGQVAPFALLPINPAAAGVAIASSFSMRIHSAIRFQQSWLGVVMHPIGILLLLAIQWTSLFQRIIGRPVGWKGRAHPKPVSSCAS